jgi:hypothetical protein
VYCASSGIQNPTSGIKTIFFSELFHIIEGEKVARQNILLCNNIKVTDFQRKV